MADPLLDAARRIADAERVAVLTGAGISVPSGIPDYRSSGSGVWANYDPVTAGNVDYFRRDPLPFYTAYRTLGRAILAARPNAAHLALSRLEAMGKSVALITQNIDSLHGAAGSRHVLELHGSLRTAGCLACGRHVPFQPLLERMVESGGVPRCADCGGLLKPDIVMFGENLPADVFSEAIAATNSCEVFLAVGSSLVVYPAAGLPAQAVAHGAALVIANRDPTPYDSSAMALLRGDVAERLPALVTAVAELLGEVEGL